MSEINCIRCGQKGNPPERVSVIGEMKEKIVASICNNCWEEWKKTSVMVINEFHLTPFLPEHRKVLEKHMTDFLGLC